MTDYSLIQEIVSARVPIDDILEMKMLKGGVFNESYRLTLHSGKAVVLQISPELPDAISYELHLMEAESEVYRMGRMRGVPFPEVIAQGRLSESRARSYLLTSCLPGMSLSEAKRLNFRMSDALQSAGRSLKKLHSIEGEAFGRVAALQEEDKTKSSGWAQALLDELQEWRKRIHGTGIFSEEECESVEEIFLEHVSVLDEVNKPLLTHGDVWEGNLLVEGLRGDCRFSGWVDADHAMYGDPEFDFPAGRRFSTDFMNGYGALSDSESARIRRRLYRLFYAFRQSYILTIRMHDEAQSIPQRETVRRILRDGIDDA